MEQKVRVILVEAFETSTRDGKTEYYYKPSCKESLSLLEEINKRRAKEDKAKIKTISNAMMREEAMFAIISGKPLEVRVVKANNLLRCKSLVDGQIVDVMPSRR